MRPVSPFSRKVLLGLALVSLGVLSACKGSSSSSGGAGRITVTGNVTYKRIPLAKDANGVPTGLQTDPAQFTSLPARGVTVRFYKSVQETAPDGSKVTVWQVATPDVQTDSSGNYTAAVDQNVPVFAEVASREGTPFRLIAGQINSSLNQADRPLYLLRKGLDGSSSTTNPTPATASSGNVTLNFSVDLADKWWIGVPDPKQATSAVLEAQGTGSRVLAILDSYYSFQSLYGRATPSDVLDLHYLAGISEPRGTFVEFDRTVYPQAFDGQNSRHYFGSVRGAAANDDAWDEAVIWLLLGRNNQAYTWSAAVKPVAQCLTHLVPDQALAEGFARGMAANLAKSPYLADTAGAGATVIDIRDRTGLTANQIGPYSGPNIGALCWDLILKANSIAAPGTPSTWANINTSALFRLFSLAFPKNADGSQVVDIFSVYGQLKRLQEAQASGEPVNLQGIFTDAVLTSMVTDYGLTWPRPTTGPQASFLAAWGTDPSSLTAPLPTVALTMANAVQLQGAYPNASEGEVAYAQFFLSKDTAYNVSVALQPATLPAGVAVELYFPSLARTLTFTSSVDAPVRLAFIGNSTTAVNHFARIRVLSPSQVAPDIQATVRLVPVS